MPAKSMSPNEYSDWELSLASYTNPSIADNGTRKELSFLQTSTFGHGYAGNSLHSLYPLLRHLQEYGNIRNPA